VATDIVPTPEEQESERAGTDAESPSIRGRVARLRTRTVALAAAVVIAAAGALAAVVAVLGSGEADAGAEPTATASVARRDLVQRSTVSGTLGYADARDVANYRQGMVTSLPQEGSVVGRGGVLYRVDAEPVVLFFGSQPAWRPLAEGVSDGHDVRQLEQNLRAIGYDDGHEMTIDEEFDASTAAAVERWQEDVGLEETGRVELGDIVFLPSARRIGSLAGSLGGRAQPGQPVMATFSTARLVTAEIDASEQEDIAVGDKVVIDLLNGTTTTGTISEVGKVAAVSGDEASEEQPASGSTTSTITFEVQPDKPAATGRLDQAPVEVGVTSERAQNVLSVPVSALLALRGGGFGVEVVRDGTTSVVPVTPGLYSEGGYVEIKGAGVKAGDRVVVPA
jgi:peptidoglycan hydrolase-like protein with peptidoglycan-binding domain